MLLSSRFLRQSIPLCSTALKRSRPLLSLRFSATTLPPPTTLAHEIITQSKDATPHTGSVVFLHGILGSAQNLRSFARRVATAYPGTQCVLVDLRSHGDSPTFTDSPDRPATVKDCAHDVAQLLTHLRLAPTVLWGHSFGGKVVLSLLDDPTCRTCQSAWVIDSQPGCVELKGQGLNKNPQSVEAILEALASLQPPFASKEDLMAQIGDRGIAKPIQMWMTTNVKKDENNAFVWKFNMDVVQELFVNYCNTDMWSSLGSAAPTHVDLHLVRAMHNPFWQRPTTPRLLKTAVRNNARLHVHDVDAGHWLHAEKPQELFDVMDGSGLATVLR